MARLPDLPLPDQPQTSSPSMDSDDGPELPAGGLEEIRKEMSGRRKGEARFARILGVIAILVLLAGGYVMVSYYRVYLARTTYRQLEAQTDLRALMLYAPSQWRKIQQLRDEARKGNWLFGAGRIVSKYNEATRLLAAAIAAAEDTRGEYERLRKRFLEKKKEARANGFELYLSALWKQLEEIEKSACNESSASFNPTVAIESLKKGIALLDEQSRYLDVLRRLATVRRSCEQLLAGQNLEEWKSVAPTETSQLQSRLVRAKAAADARQWNDAVNGYRQAEELAKKIRRIVNEKRAAAQQALATLRRELSTSDQRDIEANAPTSWKKIQEAVAAVNAAMKSWKYDDVVTAAEEARKLLVETKTKIREARTRKKELMANLKKAYDALAADEPLLLRNWEAEWTALRKEYRQVQLLAQGRDYVAFLERAQALEKAFADLNAKRKSIGQEFRKAKQAFEQAYAKVSNRVTVFEINESETWQRLTDVLDRAKTAAQAQRLREAADAYLRATALLRQAIEDLGGLLERGSRLRRECREVMSRYRRGIRVFGGGAGRRAFRLLERAQDAWRERRYRDAVGMLQEVRRLLPLGRFEIRKNGTVVDYRLGVLWAHDGKGPGCLNGQKVDWYEASRRVFHLDFAGRSNWRLPTDDELLSLARLPADELDRFFPNTQRAMYWSRVQLADDVDHALCVDFKEAARSLCGKREAHYVRAVWSPEIIE